MKALDKKIHCFTALTAAALVSLSVQLTNAHALTIANCTGSPMAIKAKDGNGADARQSSLQASPGTVREIDTSAPFISLKLYEKSLVETLRVSIPSVKGQQSYSAVRLTNGQWQLVTGRAC